MPNFVHLHNHSVGSLLDGLSTPLSMAKRAAELEQTSIALTDHGVLFSAIDFYQACKDEGVKPIVGIEPYISEGPMDGKGKNYHLTLLAMNDIGYKNLMKITTEAHLHGFYRKPRIDKEFLSNHNEGLICLSGCAASELSSHILDDEMDKAHELNEWYKYTFGDRYYLEIQDHGLDFDPKLIETITALSKESHVELVCTNDTHYPLQSLYTAHDIMLCVQTKTILSDPKRMNYGSDSFYIKSYNEMEKLFGTWPSSLGNTIEIANRCNLEIPFGRLPLPTPPIPDGINATEYLKRLVWDGIKTIYGSGHEDAINRARYELGIIIQSGFVEYFLIVRDILHHAQEQGIAYGVRGSVGGSIVAYCLGITEVDPLRYRLSFERFLNPERISMPDCDQDFSDLYRDSMVQYVRDTYGTDNVAQIITFGTMAARMSIRDVGRAMEIDSLKIDQLAKMIPFKNEDQSKVKLAKVIEDIPEIKTLYASDNQIKKVIDVCLQLEGVSRHASTHAAGVVICADPLVNHVPLYTVPKFEGNIVSQYTMEPLEKIGMLKLDFLSLRTLTIMQKTAEVVGINLKDIPLDDQSAFDLIATGDTQFVFQVESAGMRRLMKSDRPQTLEQVANDVALFRPGPMQFLDSYVKRHHGDEDPVPPHPLMSDILENTFGIPIYQEQIMATVQKVAGFTPGKADIIRSAMGKKKHDLMKKYKVEFIEGALKNNISEKDSTKLWDIIALHSGYSFNMAHAYQYSAITIKTAYLKANYPKEYMCAILSAERGNLEKVTEAINECRRLGITVLPPDIQRGTADFTIEGNSIRYGLSAIKGLGDSVAESIVRRRPYTSLTQFCRTLGSKVANKGVVESLAMVGAMSSLGERNEILENFSVINTVVDKERKHEKKHQSQLVLFADDVPLAEPEIVSVQPATEKQCLAWEREFAGAFLSKNPLESLAHYDVIHINELQDGVVSRVGGLIEGVRRITTKKGDAMAFVTLADLSGTLDVVVFPRTYQKFLSLLSSDMPILVMGKAQMKDDKMSLLADSFSLLPDHVEKKPQELNESQLKFYITLSPTGNRDEDNRRYLLINDILEQHPGTDEAHFFIDDLAQRREFPLKHTNVLVDSRLEDELRRYIPDIKLATKI